MTAPAHPPHTLPPTFPRISDYVAHYAEHTPDAEAMVLDDERISYRVFNDRIDALVRALIAAGVERGDRVATLSTPSPDYFLAFLATASIGAIWVGMNPRYQLEELAYVAGDSAPVVLLARSRMDGRDYAGDLLELKARTPSIRQLVIFERDSDHIPDGAVAFGDFLEAGASLSGNAHVAQRNASGGRDACMIVYTSGSTGKPKGALLHHEGIVGFSVEQHGIWPIRPMRALNYFPINHIGCVVDVSTPTLTAGGTIVFLEHFSPRRSLELMQDEKVSFWGSVPSTFQLQFADPDFDTFDLSSVQMVMWGGAVMPRELIERLLGYNVPLATNYGLTESGSAITIVPPSRDIDLLSGTVGYPFPGTEVRLVDPEGNTVADGQSGEILAHSVYNMLGYWNRPEATAETLLPGGWLATGDIGRRNPDGSYSIVGRVKEMYKSGGYNVYPREVETVLESHPAVDMAAVVSTADPVWQEVGVAYILPGGDLDLDDLKAFCRGRLANYKQPKRFVVLDELPLLPIGKVDKVALKKRATNDYRPADEGATA
jgi:acyl-CoA synthetase (AMP-forming)/AMP-acid ligase II